MDKRPITPPHLRTKENGWCKGSVIGALPLTPTIRGIIPKDLGEIEKKRVK